MKARARPPAVALVAFAVALAAAAAGCAGPGGRDPEPTSSSTSSSGSPITPTPSPPAPSVVRLLPDFALGPCVAVSVQSAQPLDAIQALLPEGFTAAPFGTQDTGLAALDAYACGNLTTPTVRIADVVYGQIYTHVQRPDVPGAPEGGVHEYVFRVLAGQDVLAAMWPAAGYETRNGTAAVSVDALPGLPVDSGARTGSASVGDQYRALADGQAALPAAQPWSGPFARYTRLEDGSVLLWTGTYEVPAAFTGQGVFSVAGDDPFAPFEAADNVAGSARLAESASMVGLDLRRVFPA